MKPVLFLAVFFLGSIPTAYLAVKLIKKEDIRKFGSGNVGATNAARILGKKGGLAIFAIDFLKGAVPALVGLWLTHNPETALWTGFCAVLGHVFTPFLGFKGGKGVATGAGVLCSVYPALFVLTLVIFIVLVRVTGIVSISSIVAVVGLAITAYLIHLPSRTVLFFCVIAFFIAWTHRTNIERLLKGKEGRFKSK